MYKSFIVSAALVAALTTGAAAKDVGRGGSAPYDRVSGSLTGSWGKPVYDTNTQKSTATQNGVVTVPLIGPSSQVLVGNPSGAPPKGTSGGTRIYVPLTASCGGQYICQVKKWNWGPDSHLN